MRDHMAPAAFPAPGRWTRPAPWSHRFGTHLCRGIHPSSSRQGSRGERIGLRGPPPSAMRSCRDSSGCSPRANLSPEHGGQLLLGELNCTACHKPTEAAAAAIRLTPAPILDARGISGAAALDPAVPGRSRRREAGHDHAQPARGSSQSRHARQRSSRWSTSWPRPGAVLDRNPDRNQIASGNRIYHQRICRSPVDHPVLCSRCDQFSIAHLPPARFMVFLHDTNSKRDYIAISLHDPPRRQPPKSHWTRSAPSIAGSTIPNHRRGRKSPGSR